MRYQEWWVDAFEREFMMNGFEVKTLGYEQYTREAQEPDYGLFSPLHYASKFEMIQMHEYLSTIQLRDDDILFMADISYPGFFPHVLFHKRPSKVFSFCHATSINYLDYYAENSDYKFPIETSIAKMCDKVFVGSYYHAEKLCWDNTLVTYLPFFDLMREKCSKNIKKNRQFLMMSASRKNIQKVDELLESKVETKFGKIFRPYCNEWHEYFENLGNSKILLITSFEDTFGYQIIDGYLHKCVVLAPNRCAYPEILPKEYLYNNEEELFEKIEDVKNGKLLPATSLLCEEQMKNFFKNIMEEMQK